MSFSAQNLTWKIGSKTILSDLSFEVKPGKMLGLLGPNGSGKTSLLRLLAGLKRPHTGSVKLDDQDLQGIARRALAQRVAFVEQNASTNANLRVIDVIKLGRFPHRSMFGGWTVADEDAVERAVKRTGLDAKRDHFWQSLSGGEKQRAHIARALAQSPSELILDEPTNHLDIEHQISLMRLISELGFTSIIALHDLNHAARYCDELLILKQGKIVSMGPPVDVLTERFLKEVFSVDAVVETSKHHGQPMIEFI